jgi:phenol hydroxylase P5 protein
MALSIPGSEGVTRTYSMANIPTEPRILEFQIRRTAGGLATDGWIFTSLAVGDTINLSGPYGRFVLRSDRTEPAVLIAGGTGLAPIAAMIRHALEWMYDVERFRLLEAEYPDRFTYRPCLSEEEAEGFASGMVTDVLNADHETLKGYIGYVCGPPAMVEASLKTLMLKRLFPRDIYKEEFLDMSAAATGVRSPLIKR